MGFLSSGEKTLLRDSWWFLWREIPEPLEDFLRTSWWSLLQTYWSFAKGLAIYVLMMSNGHQRNSYDPKWLSHDFLGFLEELQRTIWGALKDSKSPWNISEGHPRGGGVPCRFLKDVWGISYRCLEGFLMGALRISNDHQIIPEWFINKLLRRPHRLTEYILGNCWRVPKYFQVPKWS